MVSRISNLDEGRYWDLSLHNTTRTLSFAILSWPMSSIRTSARLSLIFTPFGFFLSRWSIGLMAAFCFDISRKEELLFSQISKTNTYSMGCWLRLRLTRSSSGFFSDSFCSTSSEYSTSNGRKLSLESWYLLLNLKIDGIQYLSFIPDTVIVRIYPGVRASFISRLISLEVHIDDRGCTICVCSVRYFT